MFERFLRIDFLSFWAGFIAASALWWLAGKTKKLPGLIKSYIQNQVVKLRQSRQSGIDIYCRNETLKRVQQLHLAKDLFSLDEILISPQLIAPPPPGNPMAAPPPMSICNQVIPYLPDFPELSASYPVQKISLSEALQNKTNFVLMGQPGCGKTVCIAHMVSQLVRREPSTKRLVDHFPIYLHILDIDISEIDQDEPLNNIIKGISRQTSSLVEAKIENFVTDLAKRDLIILFIDGLDELPRSHFDQAAKFIAFLLDKHEHLQIVTTASTTYLDGLTSLGFYPLCLSLWNSQDQLGFSEKWAKIWNNELQNTFPRQYDQNSMDQRLLDRWVINKKTSLTPLEFTLIIWASLAGDSTGNSISHALDAFITRNTTGIVSRSALEKLAFQMTSENAAFLRFTEVENNFARFKPDKQKSSQADIVDPGITDEVTISRVRKKEKRISDRQQTIVTLIENGIFAEHANSSVRFFNPIIAGYLASFFAPPDPPDDYMTEINWSVKTMACYFMTCQGKISGWIQKQIPDLDSPPLFEKLMLISRWLKGSPGKLEWRSHIFRQLFLLINNENLPFAVRARSISAFIVSKDDTSSTLFRQLLRSPSADVRQLAALGCGAIHDTKAISQLADLISDLEPDVQSAACLALGSINTSQTWEMLVDILMHSSENTRQAAAEMFASLPPNGHEILKSAVTLDDLLTRRAVVASLMNIKEDWVKPLLESVSIQDSQWVVRNAAAQMLEFITKPNPLPFLLYLPPSETPWLISFASKRGTGISPSQPVTDLLLLALREGTYEEKLAVFHFFPLLFEDDILYELNQISFHKDKQLSSAAYFTVWLLSISTRIS